MAEHEGAPLAEWPPPEFRIIEERGVTPERLAALWASRHAQQPPAFRAMFEDARTFAKYHQVEAPEKGFFRLFVLSLRFSWTSDAFLALAFYRFRVALRKRKVPILPTLLHKLSLAMAQVSIGDPVVIEPGIYLPHGQIVIDGLTNIARGVVFAPWVGIGLEIGYLVGPRVEEGVYLGTGCRLLGPIRVGAHSQVAANSVVVHDVPERVAVAGSPARVIGAARLAVKFRPAE